MARVSSVVGSDRSVPAVNADQSEAALLLKEALMKEQERIRALPCMRLTEEERGWALTIKRAVEEDEELRNLCDLDYVQYAIVTGGDVQDSLRRMRGLQVFRQEYGINDTFDQALEMIRAFLTQQPGLLLAVDKAKTASQQGGEDEDADAHLHYLLVLDFAKINPKTIRLPRDKRDMLGAFYYLHTATVAHPTAIRNGLLFIAECEGMTFDNVSPDFVGTIWREFKVYFPLRLKEFSWLRAATAATVLFSLCKPFFPAEVQAKVNLGCEFDAFEGRLDELFLNRETPEENMEMTFRRAKRHLRERFQNAEAFRL